MLHRKLKIEQHEREEKNDHYSAIFIDGSRTLKPNNQLTKQTTKMGLNSAPDEKAVPAPKVTSVVDTVHCRLFHVK